MPITPNTISSPALLTLIAEELVHGARVSATLRRRSEAAGLAHVGELDDRAHCDSRETSSDDCRNVHVLIETVPGEQIVEGGVCGLREKKPAGNGWESSIISSMYPNDIL